MICYRDTTFCHFAECAGFVDCSRALTDDVKRSAARWWAGFPGEPPIAFFTAKPPCFKAEET